MYHARKLQAETVVARRGDAGGHPTNVNACADIFRHIRAHAVVRV
jgi:hypothetical protein